MLQEKCIEPANPKWVRSFVFTSVKDGSLTFCLDYLKPNVVTIRDSYFLPIIDEGIDPFGEARIFSKLDPNIRNWQIENDERDSSKTAFASHHGLFRIV